MNKEIISKIKEMAYENVNKKLEEEKKGLLEQEVKIKELLEQYQKIEIIEGDSNE